jgi:hypothetical protein
MENKELLEIGRLEIEAVKANDAFREAMRLCYEGKKESYESEHLASLAAERKLIEAVNVYLEKPQMRFDV